MKGRVQILLISLFIFSALSVGGQVKYNLPPNSDLVDIQLYSGDVYASYTISNFNIREIEIQNQQYLEIEVPGAFTTSDVGEPALPIFSSLVETIEDANYTIKILSLDSSVVDLGKKYPTAKILPIQPSARKNSSSTGPLLKGYNLSTEISYERISSLVEIQEEGMIRGVSIGRLQFHPFKYNAEKNILIVYHSIKLSLEPDIAYNGSKSKDLSGIFKRVLSNVRMDKSANVLKKIVKEEPTTMVILSDTMFKSALEPLIDWKKQKGYNIIEAYTSDPFVGKTNEEIKEYLNDLYHNPPTGLAAPSYLLIVGDVEHIPLSQSSGQITDLYYTTYDGGDDYLPELFHGRLSVKNDTQLMNIVDKIIMYEKYEFPDPSFLDKSILIAGYDASYAPIHGNGQINYAVKNYFNEAEGISSEVYLHPSAASKDSEILEKISSGAALVNYTGHGEYYGWLDPAFRLGNIDTLKNIHKYPLMIGNGCSTNQFNMSSIDCFAEAVVKVKDRGAIGYIGCTNDSYWDEDYWWAVGIGPISSDPVYEETTLGFYDKLMHKGAEAISDWSPSMGEMIFAGNMTVQQSSSSKKQYYWEIYQLMGDPSLVPWYKVPDNPPVLYPQNIPNDALQINIKAEAYDYVAISANGELLDAIHCDKFGQAVIELPSNAIGMDLQLVVTGDYRQPYIDSIFRGNTSDGYLELLDYTLANESKIEDGLISVGEEFSLNLILVNKGQVAIQTQKLGLKCLEDFIIITDSTVNIDQVNPGDTLRITNAFKLQTNVLASDGAHFILEISREAGEFGNTLFLKETVHAPQIESSGIHWEDQSYGNGNGIIENDEKLRFTWKLKNKGTYASDSINLIDVEESQALLKDFSNSMQKGLSIAQTSSYIFSARVKNNISIGQTNYLSLKLTDGFAEVQDSTFFTIGKYVEDFSSGDLSRYNWLNSVNGWNVDSLEYISSPYSCKSGDISNNGSSSLKIELNLQQSDSIVFDYKLSSELSYDFLEFYINDTLIEKWSGITSWKIFSHDLTPGTHTLEWRYSKDSNIDRGEDAAWIDNILFPIHSFDSLDLSVLKLLKPISSKDLTANEKVSIEIANVGRNTINGFNVGYKLSDSNWIEEVFQDTIDPGNKLIVNFAEKIDMTEITKYEIIVGTFLEGDSYPGNDTMNFNIDHYRFLDLALKKLSLDSSALEHIDLLLEVTNNSNVYVEKMGYEYYLDDILYGSESIPLGLDPGSIQELSIRLIESANDSISNGWHQFLVSIGNDSVLSNNSVDGEVFWSVQSLESYVENGLQVYPNPSFDYFSIKVPDNIVMPVDLTIIDMKGKVIFSQKINDYLKSYETGSIFNVNGMFLIRIQEENGKIILSSKIKVSKN